jgi:hypothetical protein
VSATARARARAARFIEACGDPPARWRAAVLLGTATFARAEPAIEEWAAQTGALRGEWADAVAALPVLGALADLRGLESPLARRLAEALARAQADDGSFGASDEDERVFVTGRLAGWLAGLRAVRSSLLDRAGDYLAARFTPERVGGFAWRPLAAYSHFFANVPHERGDDVLQWCGRELERGFRARRIDAVQTARILVDCGATVLPGAKLDAGEVVVGLVSEQSDDGGWIASAGDSPSARVAHSLDALTALVRLG